MGNQAEKHHPTKKGIRKAVILLAGGSSMSMNGHIPEPLKGRRKNREPEFPAQS
jgi:hypothetical protein